MMALIGKEMRMTMRSFVFYIFIIVTCLFYFTSYATQETWGELGPPVVGAPVNMGTEDHPYYGRKTPDNAGELAESMKSKIGWDLEAGATDKVRIGFLVRSRLSDREKEALAAAQADLDAILRDPDRYSMEDAYKIGDRLNERLGGNSTYRRGSGSFDYPIQTYEEAVKAQEQNLARYEEKVASGQLLPGAARYFCDYLALPAGIFPVFLSAFLLLRDRSSGMSELIDSRRVSAWAYVGSKWIALGSMLSAIYLLLAVLGAWKTVDVLGLSGQTGKAVLLFLGYTAWWLLPTLWVSVSFGLFGSMLLRRGILPVAIQIVWWYVSLLPLMGSYGLYRLLIRFNSPDDYDLFREWADEIAVNRGFYAALSVLLTAAAAWLWERNRSRASSRSGFGRARFGRRSEAAARTAP